MKRIHGIAIALLSLILFGAAPQSQTQTTLVRKYNIPGHGQLVLTLEPGWKDAVQQGGPDLPPMIYVLPVSGKTFEVQLTAGWSPTGDPHFNLPDRIKDAVQKTANEQLTHARETRVVLQEMKGVAGTGYYFSLTDRAPKPGDFCCMTQGALAVNDMLVAFTILTTLPNPVGSEGFLDAISKIHVEK